MIGTQMNKEIWKPVKGFEKFYEVSNKGNVRKLERRVRTKDKLGVCRTRRVKAGAVKPYKMPIGYMAINVCIDGKKIWHDGYGGGIKKELV